MSNRVGYTQGGDEWVPQFIQAIDKQNCIGCGRCYKVCSRDVFDLVENEDIDEDDDEVMMVMTLKNAADCIGCEACSKVCPKNCQSFAAANA
ncbi:ferredoxin III, nif-specific [Vibrio diazotrophicus]|uniref:ferredoxin III, nif-specific n=1 Tax=Vibrio diazotrophicus TaxID=685 RepID=UPI001CA566B2